MMRVLLDTDVILDGLLRRQPFAVDAYSLWQACADGRMEGWISAITPVNVFYIARKQKGAEQARQHVVDLLIAFRVAPINTAILHTAHTLSMTDYEDAVQTAAAQAAGLDALVTRNIADYGGALLPVYTPPVLLTLLTTS